MTPLTLMGALAKVLPANAAVVEEAVTTTNGTLERLGALKDPAGYFGHRGWALGWGLGCALGVKLAWPERPVLALLGDGAALYGIQGLWTAAHHRIPVTFILCNNAQYQILKHCGDVMPLAEHGGAALSGDGSGAAGNRFREPGSLAGRGSAPHHGTGRIERPSTGSADRRQAAVVRCGNSSLIPTICLRY